MVGRSSRCGLRGESQSDVETAWQCCNALVCSDVKAKRTPLPESGIQALACGIPPKWSQLSHGGGMESAAIRAGRSNRITRLKGYGKSVVPQVAVEFMRVAANEV